MRKLPIIATYLLVFIATAIFLAVAIPKIFFPYEMHWMEGSMLEQVARMLRGMPLYSYPTINYIPWLYEPLYYYVTAAIASLTGLTFQIARLPSVLSTLATVVILFFVVRKETGKAFFGVAAAGLYLAAYGKVEYCYVMARIDPLFNVLLVACFVTLYYSRTSRSIIVGSALLALSYFTKQTALVFAPVIVIYLWRVRGWKLAAIFLSSLALFILGGVFILDKIYDGWFSFYTIRVPGGKGKTLRWAYAVDGLLFFVILRCWLLTVILALLPVKVFFQKKREDLSSASLFFGIFFATSIIAGFLGILNQGGGHNVLIPAAAACALFLPILVHDFSEKKKLSTIVLWLIPIQLCFLLANPWKDPRNIAMEIDKKNQEEFFRYISALPGEVWIPYHGYMEKYSGKNSYVDMAAVCDVLLVGDSSSRHLQYQLDTALLYRHWSYIVSDLRDTIPHYIFAGTMMNLNKSHLNDDTLLYIYKPEE
jgi:hypothetical protein